MDIAVRKRSGEEGVNGEGKRRKSSIKKQSAPRAQPVTLNSSDTPPESDDPGMLDLPPPPPSERKIARRRPSVRAAARAFTPDPESPSTAKRHKTSASAGLSAASAARGQSREKSAGPETAAFASSSRVPASLNASTSTAARLPGLPRPHSPPPALGSSISARRKSSMGPPTEPFVRKTRKSMSRMGFLPVDASEDSEIALPDSETPMIKKNKFMRGEQSRRSSLGMRGQRASGSLGRGEISTPHPTVDASHFYKHVGSTLPEPIRCRHLLVFCAKRSMDDHLAEGTSSGKSRDKGKSRYQGERTADGDRMVREIMEAFLSRLGKGEVATNVFRPQGKDTATGLSQLKPHPQNVLNREQEAKANSIIKRCEAEKFTWRTIKQRTNKRQQEVLSSLRAKVASAQTVDKPDLEGMEDWMEEALSLADGIIADGLGDLANKGEFTDVEFKVDMLQQSTHSALQYTHQTSRFLDGVFSTLASDLRTRDPARSGRAAEADGPDPASLLAAATTSTLPAASASQARGKTRTDPINMLRALASAEQRQQSEEGVAAARRIQPVSASAMALGVSTTAAPGTSMGPAQTPRRAGQTPRQGAAGALGASTAGPASAAGPSGVRGRIYGRGATAAE